MASRINEKWNCKHEHMIEQKDLLGQTISKICVTCGDQFWETAYYNKFVYASKRSKKDFK